MDNLFSIEVPTKSVNYFINNIGCLRYTIRHNSVEQSSCVEPHQSKVYLDKNEHEILGELNLEGKKYVIFKRLNTEQQYAEK